MRRSRIPAVVLPLLITGFAFAADPSPPSGVRRVVFLGDSITYSGQYLEYVEARLRLNEPTNRLEFLNLGLPSETVSGLSEPGHAGGQFPRPGLHERLQPRPGTDPARPGRRLLRDEPRKSNLGPIESYTSRSG